MGGVALAGMSGSGRSREGRRVYRRGAQSGFQQLHQTRSGDNETRRGSTLLFGIVHVQLLVWPQAFAVRFHTGGFGSGLLLLTDSCNLTLLPTPQSSFLSDDSVAYQAHRLRKSVPGSGGVRTRKKGLRDRNSPMCTLSQNGYGAP